MLIRFSATNHASLRERQELTLVAQRGYSTLATQAIPGLHHEVLPAAGIYGANASGKSNLIHALAFMRSAVLSSHQRWLPEQRIPRQPFRFDSHSHREPSVFEVEFTSQRQRYRYGFACSSTEIQEEWLYAHPTVKQRLLYYRDADSAMKFGPSLAGPKKAVESMTRPN
ncbi:MAG: AAA family ATPase, partial [Stackebrandtia sp.]